MFTQVMRKESLQANYNAIKPPSKTNKKKNGWWQKTIYFFNLDENDNNNKQPKENNNPIDKELLKKKRRNTLPYQTSKITVNGRDPYSLHSLEFLSTWMVIDSHNKTKRKQRKRWDEATGRSSNFFGPNWSSFDDQDNTNCDNNNKSKSDFSRKC